MKVVRIVAGVLAACVSLVIAPALIARAAPPADAGTPPRLISQEVRIKCTAESEVKWTYSHKHDGAYVLYPAPRKSVTASENYPYRCTEYITTRTWNGSAIVTVARSRNYPVK